MSPKLRRRIAMLLLAVLFSLPLFHYNFEFIYRPYNLYNRASATAPGVFALIIFGVSLLIALQIVAYVFFAWLAVCAKERLLGEVRFQLQLRTGLVLTLIAAVLLYFNTRVQRARYAYQFGFPYKISWYDGDALWALTGPIGSNLFIALGAMLVTALFCEYKLWPRPTVPFAFPYASPVSSFHNLPLTTRERWFYAMPMWLCFVIFCFASIPVFETVGFGEQYRHDPSAVLKIAQRALDLRPIYYGLILIGITSFYFSWVCRSRRAVFYFNCVLLILLYFFLLAVALSIVAMFFRVQSPMRKK